MQVRVFLHDDTEETAKVLAANEHGAILQMPLLDGFVKFQVDADGKAWGSNVHVADEDVPKLKEKTMNEEGEEPCLTPEDPYNVVAPTIL